MMFLLFFLAFNIGLGSSQSVEISQVLGRMENSMSILNLRLARIEARQTRNMLIYSRLEDNIKDVKNDLNSKHGETMLLLRSTVNLLNNLKECCQNDTNVRTSSSQTTVLSTKQVTSSNTTTTVRSIAPTSFSTAPTTSSSTTTPKTAAPVTKDCRSVNQGGLVKDGVYKLELAGKRSIKVFCSAGYVTIQRRFNGALSFDRSFAEYEKGFGEVSGESWLGLSYLHELTQSGNCTLRIILDIDSGTSANRETYRCGDQHHAADCDGMKKEILADNFHISSASDLYRVQVSWNSSDFSHPDVKSGISRMRGQKFSTKDKGPNSGCASHGAAPGGFWYSSSCYPGFPNSVHTTTDTYYCSSSNKVCGQWWPYYFTTSWIQFRC